MEKYQPLQKFFEELELNRAHFQLTFGEIEAIIDDALPASAYRRPAWWGNARTPEMPQQLAWMEAGWRVAQVNFREQWVRFQRTSAYA